MLHIYQYAIPINDTMKLPTGCDYFETQNVNERIGNSRKEKKTITQYGSFVYVFATPAEGKNGTTIKRRLEKKYRVMMNLGIWKGGCQFQSR